MEVVDEMRQLALMDAVVGRCCWRWKGRRNSGREWASEGSCTPPLAVRLLAASTDFPPIRRVQSAAHGPQTTRLIFPTHGLCVSVLKLIDAHLLPSPSLPLFIQHLSPTTPSAPRHHHRHHHLFHHHNNPFSHPSKMTGGKSGGKASGAKSSAQS